MIIKIVFILVLFAVVIIIQYSLYNKYIFQGLGYGCRFSTAEACEGDEVYLIETSENKKLLPVPWLKAGLVVPEWLKFPGARTVTGQNISHVTSGFFLAPFQKTTRRWKLLCTKRGYYKIDKVSIITGDLLGFCMASKSVDVNAIITVYPQVINLSSILISANQLQGDTVVKRWINEDPFMFSGVRDYSPDDPMSKIHWLSSAKLGTLVTRKNEFTSQYSLSVILNVQSLEYQIDRTPDRDIIELGIKIAASLFDMAMKTGMPARFYTNGQVEGMRHSVFSSPGSGKVHTWNLMNALARLELVKTKDFDRYLAEVAGQVSYNQVVIISAYINSSINESIRKMQSGSNAIKFIALKHFDREQILPGVETYFTLDSKIDPVGGADT